LSFLRETDAPAREAGDSRFSLKDKYLQVVLLPPTDRLASRKGRRRSFLFVEDDAGLNGQRLQSGNPVRKGGLFSATGARRHTGSGVAGLVPMAGYS
jgi:hypothetical protein